MKSTKKPSYQELEKLIDKLKLKNKLTQSEKRISMLLKANEDMITIHQLNGKYLYYSGPTCYDVTAKDIVGKMPSDLFDKDISNTLLDTFEKVKKTGKSETIEVLLDWLGEKKWFSEYIYPVKNTDGEVVEIVKICKDIHKRKAVQQEIKNQNKALVKSKKDYIDVVETTTDLITVVDNKGDIIFVNYASMKFFGLKPEECKGRSAFDFIHPEDVEFTKNEFTKWVASGNKTFQLKNRQVNITGDVLKVSWNINFERANNEITKITSIGRDITEEKKAEKEIDIQNEKLHKLNNVLNQAQKLAGIGSWTFDVLAQKLEWSDEAFRIWGFDSKKPMPENDIIRNRIHPDDLELFNNSINKAISIGTPYSIELRFLLPNDEKKTVKSICKPTFGENGKVISLSGTVQNITRLKEGHRKLEESENRLNEAQKLARVGSWTFDISTQKNEWSDETFHIWGLDSKKGVPDFNRLAEQIHIDDQKTFISSIDNAINLGTPYIIEFRISLPFNEQKWIKAICKPILGGNEKPIVLTGTNQDITSLKQFEEAQVKHQRLKAIGEMSASIAHDFNNSLQQMMGNLEIIKFQKGLSDISLKRLNNIKSIMNDAADRVSALQQFGDVEHDEKNTKLIDFNALIKESLDQSRPLWKDGKEKDGLQIHVITDFEDIPKISSNVGELKSVVYNLIKNSIEAMPKGGNLIIKTGTKAEHVYVTFTDTGTGMDQDTQSKVFDPFFSTKGFELGRGLGMSGVYNIVKKYKGDIVVKSSELDKGTTFEIAFPICQQDISKVMSKSESKDNTSYNVLWVDDDSIITEDISELVELIGHKCTSVNSGKNALDYLNKNTCDIVFTDIGMPGMNGWELIKGIREKFGNKIKIVTVSGWSIDEQVKKKNTIDFVLQKPFTLNTLEELFLQL